MAHVLNAGINIVQTKMKTALVFLVVTVSLTTLKRKEVKRMEINMTAVIMTAIICVTLVMLAWVGRKRPKN